MQNQAKSIDKFLFRIKNSRNFEGESNKFKEILDQNRLNHKQLVNATYIAHMNYKKNQKLMQEVMKKIENELAENFNGFPYDSKNTIIRNLMELVNKGYNLSRKDLGSAILESILFDRNEKKYPKLLLSIASMLNSFESLNLDYKTKFKELEASLTQEYLEKLSLADLSMILAAFKLYYTKVFNIAYKTKNPLPLFENSENLLTTHIANSTDINLIYLILFNYVSLNTGTEDFIRNIEEKLTQNLHQLSEFNFKGFPFLYKSRFSSDQRYMIYVIFKSFYEELIKRFNKLSASDLSTILYRLWWSSSKYGLYCDARLITLLNEYLNDEKYILSLSEEDGFDLVTNIFSLLTQAAVMDDKEILSKVSAFLTKFKNGATDRLLLSSVSIMSRHSNVPNSFWNIFFERFTSISQENSYENDCYMYSIYLNVTLNNPEMKEKFEEVFRPILPRIISQWKRSSSNSQLNHNQSFLHKTVEDFLRRNNIKYEKEFYDDYYIDLVAPDYKLAIEIQGPNHYIYPSVRPNGKTLNKIRNLEKKGWRVLQLPWYHYRHTTIELIIRGYISSFSPIKF